MSRDRTRTHLGLGTSTLHIRSSFRANAPPMLKSGEAAGRSPRKNLLASPCRAYICVVLRLRAEAEAMERDIEGDMVRYQLSPPQTTTLIRKHMVLHSYGTTVVGMSRICAGAPSRSGSPGDSSLSHSHYWHTLNGSSNGHGSATGMNEQRLQDRNLVLVCLYSDSVMHRACVSAFRTLKASGYLTRA